MAPYRGPSARIASTWEVSQSDERKKFMKPGGSTRTEATDGGSVTWVATVLAIVMGGSRAARAMRSARDDA